MSSRIPVTVARGDGIGPEIMDATLKILDAANAQIEPEFVTMGEQAYKNGIATGIDQDAWDSIARTNLLLKAPLTTPQGGGYKSVNVTLRKSLGLFANVRPVRTLQPFVRSKHDDVDMVIVRENEEDLYAGVEYRQTHDTCHAVKLLSRSGCEMIIRYAFEYARANGRKKVTCLIKDNIMKISDGLFHKVFDLVGEEYPEIEKDALIVDIGMARVADTPERFDVVVTLNLYGDIVSDIASQVAGSVGLAGSFNMGAKCAMFEAVHGSAPDISGKNIANPSGILNAAVLMLHHIGQNNVAAKIENAWLSAIENGCHTADIAKENTNPMGTSDFADAVIKHLGQQPKKLKVCDASSYRQTNVPDRSSCTISNRTKALVGVDVFVDWKGDKPAKLGSLIKDAATDKLPLTAISSRGMKVYPGESHASHYSDMWHCRFMANDQKADSKDVATLLTNLQAKGVDWVKVENLYTFDEETSYSAFQGD